MKKLMIAAAIVCASALSYGAAAPWKTTLSNIYKANTTDKYTGTVYIMDAGLHSMSAVLADWLDGKTVTGYAASSITVSNGAGINKTFNYGVGGNDYDLYAMIVMDDKIYFSNQLDDKGASTSETAATLSFGSQNDPTTLKTFSSVAPKTEFAGGGYWYSAVPEPTSGLLLLLGVAGLALRRRRA